MAAGRFRVTLIALALLAGCGRMCNERGCINGVDVIVGKEFAVELLPVEIRICADEVCRLERIEPTQAAPGQETFGIAPSIQLDAHEERDVDVSLEIQSLVTGEVLVSATGIGTLRHSQPNGDGCPPTCFGALLRLDESAAALVDG